MIGGVTHVTLAHVSRGSGGRWDNNRDHRIFFIAFAWHTILSSYPHQPSGAPAVASQGCRPRPSSHLAGTIDSFCGSQSHHRGVAMATNGRLAPRLDKGVR